MMRNDTRSLQFALVAVLLVVVAGCDKKQASGPEAESSGVVEGTLTVNGKTEALKHAYARRRPAVDRYAGGAAIEVLLTSQPVSRDLLTKIFGELDKEYLDQRDEGLKGIAPRGLWVSIPKSKSYNSWAKTSFQAHLLMPEGLIGMAESNEFESFDLQKGTAKAKARDEWKASDLGDFSKPEKQYECSYSFTFEASLGETAVRPMSAGMLPVEGTANGMMMSEKAGSATLKYSYAWRERLLFDEPDEQIVVLVTDRPIPKEAEAGIVSGRVDLSSHGLQGIRFFVNEFGKIHWGHVIDKTALLNTNRFKNVELAVENGRVKGKADFDKHDNDDTDFSVVFDAPLKN